MAFNNNKAATVQQQFQIIEIDTTSITGVCTNPDNLLEGYYTPLSCIEQHPQGIKTYYFASENTPVAFGNEKTKGDGSIIISEPIYRVINQIAENPTVLKPGEGLAGRGTLNVVFSDFIGDPSSKNPTSIGTFFGKFLSRNILNNREIRVKYFHIKDDNIYTAADGLTRTYLISSATNNGKGRFTISARDELTKADKDKSQFPEPTNGELRLDIDASVVSIPVDQSTTYAINDIIFIGGEFMRVTGVANIGTPTATLTVATRGSDITGLTSTKLLTKSVADTHSSGDSIQICYESDNQRIDDLLQQILLKINVNPATITIADWILEVDTWHNNERINTVWFDPQDANKVVKLILVSYLMDLWYDSINKQIRLSAISVWKASTISLSYGKEIDYDTLKVTNLDDMRFSRAYVFRDKPFLSKTDDIQNYKALTVFQNSILEETGLYGEPKTKNFGQNPLITKVGAELLTQRFVSRFGFAPVRYSWTTQERFLNFNIGDIVSITSSELQNFDGSDKEVRAQILSVKPRIGRISREYSITALTYEAAFQNGTEFTVSGVNCELNLYTLAGAPSSPVNLTFVFDGATLCSRTEGVPSVIAGNFASGSKITIILKNNSDWQGLGGRGGAGGNTVQVPSGPITFLDGENGHDGGTCYDAQGIDTDIYLSGSISGHTALGTLRAPGGGGSGAKGGYVTFGGFLPQQKPGNGGGGGGGYDFGIGGLAGVIVYDGNIFSSSSVDGNDGTINCTGGAARLAAENSGSIIYDSNTSDDSGAGGDCGQPGTGTGVSLGGAAGKAIVSGGGLVCLFGDAAGVNYIQGNGEAVCSNNGPTITNVQAIALTDSAATITWNTDVPATSQVNYGLTTSYGSSTTKDTNLVTNHSQTITGLTASTNYNYQVSSDDSVGNNAVSANKGFVTAAGADVTPPVISNVFTANILSTSFAINWDTDEGATSQVEYGTTTAYGNLTALNTNLDTAHGVTLGNLSPSTLYHFRILAKDAAGNLATGIDRTETTAATGTVTISYLGGTVANFDISPATITGGFRFSRNGLIYKNIDNVITQWQTWAVPQSANIGDSYEIRATKISGANPDVGTLGVWLPITQDRDWSATISTSNVTQFNLRRIVLLIEVRDIATQTIQESQQYTISLDIEGNQ